MVSSELDGRQTSNDEPRRGWAQYSRGRITDEEADKAADRYALKLTAVY